SIESTEWFVESDTLDGIAAKHHFSSAGIFPVRLKVVNEAGCVTEKTEGIVIHEKPVAQFSPKIACQYTVCDIYSTSQAGDDAIVSYEWQGLQRKENNKKFEFVSDSVAAYPIMLTVVSEYGCVDTLKDSVVVVESSKVEFVHTRTCIGDTVLIIDETVCQPYNYMLSGQWEYDGVTLPYKKILMVRLEDTIPHSVGLFVKTFNGCLNIMRDTIQAHVLPQPKLPEVLYGCIGKDIVLRDFGESDDSIAMRQWSIGDEILTEEAPTVHFAESGTYDYSLALTTEYECSSSTAGQIVVEKTPVADFTFFPEYGAAPLDVQFTNTSVGAATSLWTFESSVEVAEENPEYTFTEEALSYVQLRVASEHGCADSIQKYVSVQLSNMKLQITDVFVSEQNGKVHYTIQVLNSGNDVIPEIEFSLSSPDFPTLTELWTGKLLPNTVLTYEFTTKTALKNKELPAYVCVDASIASSVQNKIGYTDTYCKDFSDEFNVYSVSPNPVTDVAVLAFSTKQNETIVVECVDESGKIRMSQELPAMPSGFHTCRIDMSQLPSGIYAIRVLQGNKKETIQVIKI
ncbi:MAG: T9SS type A sorting domain-containing protein, partial [Bacteroidales bacterium]|nr:T9SS type A sorting domain-containing protein [Bacteroidales bacterium]